jgi:plastocyanin
MVKNFMAAGIAMRKVGKLTPFLHKHTGKRLMYWQELPAEFIPHLLQDEEKLQRLELGVSGKPCCAIHDATPRQGDLYAVVIRDIVCDEQSRRARARHTLIYVSTIAGSLNNATLSHELSTALAERQILQENVHAAAMDRCFTNSASANEMNDSAAVAGKHARLISFCMSHMICNAGDTASFILLELFWTYIQKVFATSQQARDEWENVVGMTWPTHSETRWFSKYDVFEKLSQVFPDLLTVMTNVVRKGISPANSTKLLNLLLDPLKSKKLAIELSAYVEVLFPLRNLCYWLERDDTDVAFRVADKMNEFQAMFPDGTMMNLPSTERLIMEVSVLIFITIY